MDRHPPLTASDATNARRREDIIESLERAPAAFLGLLQGRNFGKLLVQVGMKQLGSQRVMTVIGTKRKCRTHTGISGAEGSPADPSACRRQPPLAHCVAG